MKNYLQKLFLLVYLLFFNCMLFASDNNDPIANNEIPESGDPAPIDSGLIWLVLIGITFALYYYSTQRKKQVD